MPIVASMVALASVACGASLSEEGRRVVVVDDGGPWFDREAAHSGRTCQILADLSASGSATETFTKSDLLDAKSQSETRNDPEVAAKSRALVKLRNESAERGGTHLYVQSVRTERSGRDPVRAKVEVAGRVYRCPSAS